MDLTVCILWHMHQPVYWDAEVEEYLLPWVFLHGVKDYYEMARLLEEAEDMHLTVNFVPSLLDQLEGYGPPGSIPRDRFLRHYLADPAQMDQAERDFVVRNFFSAHPERQIRRSPRYTEIHQMTHGPGATGSAALEAQDLLDLQVWFLLSWCGEFLREEDPLVARLVRQDRHFVAEDKRGLLTRMQGAIAEIVPRYRALAERGQVELSFTPYYHPILPLLCDTESGVQSNASTHLPRHRLRRPGDAEEQIRRGRRRHQEVFGIEPRGCWPSEGSLSQPALELLAQEGVGWAASDERVLFASAGLATRHGSASPPTELYRLYSAPGEASSVTLFFRDQYLSDRIGFAYSSREPEAAVDDFIGRLQEICLEPTGGATKPVVNIILDGENAWEFYEENGRPFLRALYRELVKTKGITPRTFGEAIDHGVDSGSLDHLHPGSWINGNFNIWIGHQEKNLAWDWVSRGVDALEQATDLSTEEREDAYKALLAAEGSDWFWWFGDDHYSAHDALFDHLFRAHLREVYRRLGRPVPDGLRLPIARIRRALLEMPKDLIQPRLDGSGVRYLDWLSGGRLDLAQAGAMHPSEHPFTTLRFGFDEECLYLRLEAHRPFTELVEPGFNITFYLDGSGNGTTARVRLSTDADNQPAITVVDADGNPSNGNGHVGRATIGEVLEAALALPPLDLEVGDSFHLSFGLADESRLPLEGPVELTVPSAADYQLEAWMV